MKPVYQSLLELLNTADDGAVYLGDRRVLLFDASILGRVMSRFLVVNGPFEGIQHIWNFGYACGFQLAVVLKPKYSNGDKAEWLAETLSRMELRGFADIELRSAEFGTETVVEVAWTNTWHGSEELKSYEHADMFPSLITGMLSGAASAIKGETVLFVSDDDQMFETDKFTGVGRTDWSDDDEEIKNLTQMVEDITHERFSFSEHMEKTSPTLQNISRLIMEIESRNFEIESLQMQLHHLQEVGVDDDPQPEMIGMSSLYKLAINTAEKVADSDTTVLIQGETGTGKELFARYIHKHSNARNRPLITVNCAALPESLVESELFGHEKGAFTGAVNRRPGRFEIANGSTIFLDEVGELPLETQAKFLRVLQEGEFERLGGSQTIKTNARVIAATNRDLAELVKEGKFRADLFYRLNVFPITVPPLRERGNDVVLLTKYFAQIFRRRFNKPITSIDNVTIESLKEYAFPGNVRELKHIIERAVLLSNTEILHIDRPESSFSSASAATVVDAQPTMTLEEMERKYISDVVKSCNGMIGGKGGAAEILDLPASTLRSKMKKLGIL